MKPHKGKIVDWVKQEMTQEQKEYYEKRDGFPSLGFYIIGTCVDHPNFGTNRWFHTSYVVKQDGNEIETRNSRYTLV